MPNYFQLWYYVIHIYLLLLFHNIKLNSSYICIHNIVYLNNTKQICFCVLTTVRIRIIIHQNEKFRSNLTSLFMEDSFKKIYIKGFDIVFIWCWYIVIGTAYGRFVYSFLNKGYKWLFLNNELISGSILFLLTMLI